MTTKNKPGKPSKELKAVVSRIIQAPCARVFEMWTDANHMAQWFSPEDIECRSLAAAVKVGGKFRIHMVSKKGDHIAIGKYQKIIPNKYLQFTWQWKSYAMPDSVVAVEFEDLGKTTRLTLTHRGLPDQEDAADHKRGWASMLKKYARLVKQGRVATGSGKITAAPVKEKVIQPYLLFGGRCTEALKFYRTALGAEVDMLMRYKDSPEPLPAGMLPPGYEDKVMHASFRVGGNILMASDGCGEKVSFDGFSLHLSLATAAEADRAFKALAAGGQVKMSLTKTFWAPRFGMLTDRFGLGWMISVAA